MNKYQQKLQMKKIEKTANQAPRYIKAYKYVVLDFYLCKGNIKTKKLLYSMKYKMPDYINMEETN